MKRVRRRHPVHPTSFWFAASFQREALKAVRLKRTVFSDRGETAALDNGEQMPVARAATALRLIDPERSEAIEARPTRSILVGRHVARIRRRDHPVRQESVR